MADTKGMSLFARSRPQEEDRWKRALEAALHVSEIASSGVALPSAVQQVVTTAKELFGAEQSSVMLLDDAGRELVMVASSGLPPEVKPGHRLPIGESVAGRVLATGRPLLLGEVDSDSFINFVPKSRPIRSSLVAPLRVNGRSIGVLNLSTSSGRPTFTEHDRRLGQMFADQAANLINRTRLHEKAEQRSSDLAALIEASQPLLGQIELDLLLEAVLDGATRLSRGRDGLVCLFDQETGALARGIFRGIDKSVIRELTQHQATAQAISNGSMAVVELGSGTFLAIGIRSSRSTKGLLALRGGADMRDASGHLLQAFGQQCAGALGSAELHSMILRKESELGSIIQSVGMPIILVDSSHRIVSLNPPAEQIFGVSSAFCGGMPVEGALDNTQVESFLLDKGDLTGEVEVGSPSRSFRVRVTDVRVPGAPMGRLLVMDDITTERELSQTQHDFVAMIGHELRTPLTIVKGFTRMLLQRGGALSPEDAVEALTTIDTKSAELERLIEDLLYVSGIESRESTLRIEEVDLREVIEGVILELLESYSDREVKIDLPPDLTWACDATKVALITRHLVDNALKYSDPGAPIVVRASEVDGDLQVDVIDKGVGLVSSDIPFIFDRFRQVDGTATRERGGAGVGLYLCSRLVKVHAGRIWVNSTWGKGSTFSFTIPPHRIATEVKSLKGKKVQDLSA